MAQGIITPNTPRRLRDLLRQISPAKLPVVLDSRGGDLDAALEIGRMIRAAGLTTIIGRSEVEGCGPRDDCSGERTAGLAYQGFVSTPAECSGTCLFALAGGTQRIGFWSNGASLPALDHFKTRSHGTDAAKLIANYLADMGISAGLVVRLRSAGLTLDRPDLLHFALITGRERVEDFTGASICLGPSPAANCLLPEPAPPAVRMSSAPPRPEPRRPGRLIIWGALD